MSTKTKARTITVTADPWPDLPDWAWTLTSAADRIGVAGAVAAEQVDRIEAYQRMAAHKARMVALRSAKDLAKDALALAVERAQGALDDLSKPDHIGACLKAAEALIEAEQRVAALNRLTASPTVTGSLGKGVLKGASTAPQAPPWSYQDARLCHDWITWAARVEAVLGEHPQWPAPEYEVRQTAMKWDGLLQSAEVLKGRIEDPALAKYRQGHEEHLARFRAILDGQPDPGEVSADIPPIWVERVTAVSAGYVPNAPSTGNDEPGAGARR